MLGDEDDGWGRRGFGGYPTLINRVGPDVGKTQESAMAQGVIWPKGCQTVEFVNHDGSVTTYRTHGGMPQVTTEAVVIAPYVCVLEDLLSPLTETSYAARTYHPDDRIYSTNGIYSIPLKPINRLTVTTGDTPPLTRAICLAKADGLSGVRTAETDIVESGRTYNSEGYYQRVSINGTFIPCAFDARLTKISLAGKCSRPLSIQVHPTGSVAATHGSVFGDHVAGSITTASARVMGLSARTAVTLKKFQLVLASPGKLFERIEDAAWSVLNTLTTPFPNAEFPWNRRLHRFAGLKCFQRVNGNLYADQTMATLIDATARPASFSMDTEFAPRYFRLTANLDYVGPSNYIFPGDAIFPRRQFCFPEAVYSGRVFPFRLLPWEHLFKCAAGQVWKVGVTVTPGSGSTDNYKIYLRNRFDSFLETSTTVDRLIGEVNAKNWSAYPNSPTGAPTKRPTSHAITSKPDGTEAYVLGYWEDVLLAPASDRKRTLTSILRLVFSESGASNPTTGVGVGVTVQQVDVFADFVNTSTSSDLSTSSSSSTDTTVEDIGTCGTQTLHKTTQVITAVPGIANLSNASELSYRRLLWVYASHTNVFDLVHAAYSIRKSGASSGTLSGGAVTYVTTDYCAGSEVRSTGVSSGTIATNLTKENTYDYSLEIISSVRGVLIPKIGFVLTTTEDDSYYYDYSGSWAYPSGPSGGVLFGTRTTNFDGSFYSVGAGAFSSILTHDYHTGADTETGTRYMSLPDTSDEFTTLWLISGASYHTTELRVWEVIDGVMQDYSAGAGVGPRKFPISDKIYHGIVVPLATPIQRVCINARTGASYIVAADADAGHFY